MVPLFFRNLLFTILQPGIVAGLIPYWILDENVRAPFMQSLKFYHYLSIIAFGIGFIILLTCIMSFAVQGRGTLSPADPTKKLVISGLYKFSRNPMYVGVTLMLIGESIFFQSNTLSIYTLCIFSAFNIFIIFFEEPRLARDFGYEYSKYREKVRRWV